MQHQPVDLTNVRDIIGDNPVFEQSLCKEFIRAADEAVTSMKQNTIMQDQECWRKTAHMLKGIAYNIGAYALGDLCKMAQEGANVTDNEKEQISSIIQKEYGEVKRYLESLV